ncbi:MAG: ABC transporter substrate-binding protein [Bosea sp. (in: a-proteobacteria)]
MPSFASATDYPLTVTDLGGRRVEIKSEPKRIVIQDGRDLFTLALLDRKDPFQRIVGWNNILSRSDNHSWSVFAKAWPESSARATDFKFGDEGQLNLELVASSKADLIIAQKRVLPALEDAKVIDRMAQLGVPVLLVDSELDPTNNAPQSVTLLGKVLNREAEAAEYAGFYRKRLDQVRSAMAGAPPIKVFVEAKAGQKGLDSCCFTHGDVYWGKLITAAGGQNLGASLVKGRTGEVALETVLGARPDVYVLTGSPFANQSSVSPPFGLTGDKAAIDAAMTKIAGRKGFEHLKAIQARRLVGLYHQLYASSWNIYAVEFLAKAFYPERLRQIDPDATLRQVIGMTGLPKDTPAIFGATLATR